MGFRGVRKGEGNMEPTLRTPSLLQDIKQEQRHRVGAGTGRDRGSCSRFPRWGHKREWSRQPLPHPRDPQRDAGHTPPSLLLDHPPPAPPGHSQLHPSGPDKPALLQSEFSKALTPPGGF